MKFDITENSIFFKDSPSSTLSWPGSPAHNTFQASHENRPMHLSILKTDELVQCKHLCKQNILQVLFAQNSNDRSWFFLDFFTFIFLALKFSNWKEPFLEFQTCFIYVVDILHLKLFQKILRFLGILKLKNSS